MKILKGKMYYSKNEVAELVGRNHQTIHLWHKYSEQLEKLGKERLIPAPLRLPNNYRMWSEDDVELIKQFAEEMDYGKLKLRLEQAGLTNYEDTAIL
jgi:hypothetical protein